MNVDFDDLQSQIVGEIDSYVYSVPAEAVGNPWPKEKVQAHIDQLRQSLVRPYSQSVTLRDTPDQFAANPPKIAQYVIVADDGESNLVFFDPHSNEFGLAQRVAGGQPVTIGVRGDVVGVFMAR